MHSSDVVPRRATRIARSCRAARWAALWIILALAGREASSQPPGPTPTPPRRPAGVPQDAEPLDTTRGFRGAGVQSLDDLQSLVIEGPPGSVEALAQIIAELDRLNIGSEAGIEVVRLLHTDSESLVEALRQVYDAREAARPQQQTGRGRVGFVPIAQPNAVIVISPPAYLADVVAFVELLDRNSTAAGSQFRVFRLRQATASVVRAKLIEFFAVRQDDAGLRVRVEVVADDRTNALIVYAGPNDLDQAARLIEQLDNNRNEAVHEMRVFPLKNAQAASLAALLNQAIAQRGAVPGAAQAPAQFGPGQQQQPTAIGAKSAKLKLIDDEDLNRAIESGILEDVTVSADERTNTLVVTAPSQTMTLVGALIQRLDKDPGASQTIRIFTLQHSNAEELLSTLQQIFLGTTTGAAGTAVPPAAGVGAPGAVGAGGPGATTAGAMGLAISSLPIRFTINYRTNSIVASASPEDLKRIEETILQLDSPEIRQRETVVYRFNNLNAPDAVLALNEYLTRERLDTQISIIAIQPPTTQQDQAQEVVTAGGVQQTADRTPLEPATNSIVITANAGFLGPFLRVVEDLDSRPPQVLIQVLIAQIDLTDNDEFGIEVGLQNDILFDRSVVVGGTNGGGQTLNPGYNFNTTNPLQSPVGSNPIPIGAQSLTNFALGRASPLGYGGLILAASNENISVLLRALKRQRRLEILSRPQVMALDNQQASIQIGQRIRVPTGSVTAPQGGTTSSFQAENIGIILAVTPRIAPDGTILMRVAPQISSLERDSSGAIQGLPVGVNEDNTVIETPIINITQAVTTVSTMDGETVVIGGLISKERSIEERKIPVLGDLPYINWLFKTRFRGMNKRELMIILTPHVVYNQADADRIKQIESCRIDWIMGDVREVHGDLGIICPPNDLGKPCCIQKHLGLNAETPVLNMPHSSLLPYNIPWHKRRDNPPPPAGAHKNGKPHAVAPAWEADSTIIHEEIIVPIPGEPPLPPPAMQGTPNFENPTELVPKSSTGPGPTLEPPSADGALGFAAPPNQIPTAAKQTPKRASISSAFGKQSAGKGEVKKR